MESKEVLTLLQIGSAILSILVTVGGFAVIFYRIGQFTERVDTGLADVRKDLADHTSQEEKIQGEHRHVILDLMQAKATTETRLAFLEGRAHEANGR